ncbi:hypothetical protein T492DRAFT_995870 [Pavlovales sp. CCMP2436]|nr:hypothetical protein T492DRAFT_995870 [Pavlovales sp. CCMP2436]|mmetsp:Transcript_47909/g.111990  ORF Transcript_47909/g.111990 Transcript_47909/m.111990 type:complete len:151 (+) Transcript_47909:51-503(+)
MDESNATLQARRARFAREKANPMAAPKRTMAWAGGKIASNKEAALSKFLARKGEELSDEQLAGVENARNILPYAVPRVLRDVAGNTAPLTMSLLSAGAGAKSQADKGKQKLRKKLGEIVALEKQLAAGMVLEKNQLEKIKGKPELLRALA